MKKLIIGIAITATIAAGCDSGSNRTEKTTKNDSSQPSGNPVKNAGAATTDEKVNGSMKEMVAQYLQMKNALVNDNGKEAAAAGNAYVESMGKMDKNSLTGDKKKKWDALSDDAQEMAQHIGKNADKLAHQREHFDMLSKDMYDMVKTFGAGQTLYKDYCPMANDKKGATWLSETKEIKNPYMGKQMPTCGIMKEEIK